MRVYFLKREIVSIYDSHILKRDTFWIRLLDLIFPTLYNGINIVM
jgi:hypothetical protein